MRPRINIDSDTIVTILIIVGVAVTIVLSLASLMSGTIAGVFSTLGEYGILTTMAFAINVVVKVSAIALVVAIPILIVGKTLAKLGEWRKDLEEHWPNSDGQTPVIIKEVLGSVVVHDQSKNPNPTTFYVMPSLGRLIVELLYNHFNVNGAWKVEYPNTNTSEQLRLALAALKTSEKVAAEKYAQDVTVEPRQVINAKSVRFESKAPEATGNTPEYERVGEYEQPQPEYAEQPVLPSPDRLPKMTLLTSLVGDKVSLDRLVLGQTIMDGRLTTVYAGLEEMRHTLLVGSTGWGKSVSLMGLLFQIAIALENCDLVLADKSRVGFATFRKCNKLLYPVVDNDNDLIRVLNHVSDEEQRRQDMFLKYEGVDTLRKYNAVAPEPLSPFVLAIDEASQFLQNGEIQDRIVALSQTSRHFGLQLILAGQTFSSKDLDTRATQNFPTVLQFFSNVKTSSQTLVNDASVRDFKDSGRCFLTLAGRSKAEVQVPYCEHGHIAHRLVGNGPRHQLEELPAYEALPALKEGIPAEEREAILRLHSEGKNLTEICQTVYHYPLGGQGYYNIKEVLGNT